MGTESGGMNTHKKRTSKRRKEEDVDFSDVSDEENDFKYAPYSKKDHIRVYPLNAPGTRFTVYLESTKPDEKFGNKSPLYLNNIFSRFVKGVKQLKRVNASKYAVMFDNAKNANNLINNSNFLKNHEIKAYIPASEAECIGVIKFVPTEISNKKLFNKLTASQEILSIRRFTKKTPTGIVPLQTVSITFAGNMLPEYVTYELCALRVEPYVRPVLQCYNCMSFGHTSKFCKKATVCSICGNSHSYKDCDKPNSPCCVNCKGEHIAIASICPIKRQKLEENRNKIMNKITLISQFPQVGHVSKTSHSQNINTKNNNYNKTKILEEKDLIAEFVNNDVMINALVKTLTMLNDKDKKLTVNTQTIKELFIQNLTK